MDCELNPASLCWRSRGKGNMQKRNKIYNKSTKLNDEDRITLASLLIKAGYVAKTGCEAIEGKKQKTYYVEYWEE